MNPFRYALLPYEDWQQSLVDSDGGIRLRIAYPPGGESWRQDGPAYWHGTLAGLTPVRSSPHAVVLRGPVRRSGPVYYFKRYKLRGAGDTCKRLLRASRAQLALNGGALAARHGFHAPEPVCLIEARKGPFGFESALITLEISAAPTLRQLLKDRAYGLAGDYERKRALLRALGREVGAWHQAGLYHGDMRAGNILVRPTAGAWDFFWLDNERNRHFTSLPEKRRLRNLMQLAMESKAVSTTDSMRFWRAYAAAVGLPRRSEKQTLRRIIRWTRHRWQRRGWC